MKAPFDLFWMRYQRRGRVLNNEPTQAVRLRKGEQDFIPGLAGRRPGLGYDFYFPWWPPHKRTIIDLWR